MSSEVVFVVVLVAIGLIVIAMAFKQRSRTMAGGAGLPAIDAETLLQPVREQIAMIAGRLDNLVTESVTTRTEISSKIATAIEESRAVFDQGAELRDTTTRISTALRGTGQRGSWGQIQLERVVELAGLTEHVTFKKQVYTKTEDGKKFPDLVVYLPDRRSIIIDAKAPNLNLEDRESATDENLKDHIDTLSGKNYPATIEGAMDFVILFVPSEGTLASALTADPNLNEYAFKKNILLATPMTLLGLLRAVEFGWQQLQQVENIAIINKQAQELCERVLIFIDHLAGIKKGLADAVESYNSAVTSVNTRLLVSVRKMRELGVRVDKSTDDFTEAPTEISEPPVAPTSVPAE